ncbi:hypothetical protein [Ruminococcus albus]|jgi:hypothetical protein|uniref:Uncharacterized protein n=1 Tax=Ruminococcus albus (strain ATCC 27210 / DSM 20455 / JCM 14654 / NCDO 2250 / 7) TaxID=697329 RepID=E6UJN8_RUMA7|nr:hypothetical protein [Ruminococcus albus]ADU23884.1 hypothetical protein Rumal_3433 [Ruminococcus albus 7 = DSM 20455]
MNDIGKGMLLVLLILYIASPVDLMPMCPIDDIIAILLYTASSKKSKTE